MVTIRRLFRGHVLIFDLKYNSSSEDVKKYPIVLLVGSLNR